MNGMDEFLEIVARGVTKGCEKMGSKEEAVKVVANIEQVSLERLEKKFSDTLSSFPSFAGLPMFNDPLVHELYFFLYSRAVHNATLAIAESAEPPVGNNRINFN